MALIWLTLGASFINDHLLKKSDYQSAVNQQSNPYDHTGGPFENGNEEEAEISLNDFASEFLKTDTEHVINSDIIINHNWHHSDWAFVNFCRDCFSPPPEKSIC